MEHRRPLTSSPVLFGRDDLLALGGRRLQQAGEGRGQLMFRAGEAGIGKTRHAATPCRGMPSTTVTGWSAQPCFLGISNCPAAC